MKTIKKGRKLPIDWFKIKINDKFKVCSGGTPLSSKKEYYIDGNIPWINSGELNNRYIYSTNNYISKLGFDNSSTTIYPVNSVLVALYGATAGKVSLLNIAACSNQAVCAIYPNKNFSSKFLLYSLTNLYDYLFGITNGSARSNLSVTTINEIELYMPPLAEQEKIANVLSALDDKIELNNRINKKLEEMARTLYDYWFLQFDFPDENGRPYKSSGGSMTYNPILKKEISTGWEVVALGDIIEEMPKSNIQVNEADKVGGNIPFIKSGESMGTYNKSLVSGRYIFLNTGGNAGVKFYVGNVAYSTDTWCINAIDNMTDYLYIFLSYIVNQIQRNCFEGTGLQHLQKDIFKQIKIIKPENFVIEKYNKIICPLFNQYYKNKQENRKLEAARDFLLPMLMNGQATVAD